MLSKRIMEHGYGRKIYSPDLKTFDLEGSSGVFNTLSSIIVGPVRIVTRVMHNIMILPPNLLQAYTRSLQIVGCIMAIFGVVDLVVFRKWPLLVSQIPVVIVATRVNKQASKASAKTRKKHKVEIHYEEVQTLCESIYDEINGKIGSVK